MQQGLIQALMTVLPGAASSMPSSVLKADGQVDFAGFLQSMAPALEQQLAQMPSDARASLLAELGQEIRHAQAIAEVTGPEAEALDAMLGGASGADQDEGQEASSVLEQLFAMLGVPPAGAGASQIASLEAVAPVVEAGGEAAVDPGALATDAMPLLAGLVADPARDPGQSRRADAGMDLLSSDGGKRRTVPQQGIMPPTAQGEPQAQRSVDRSVEHAALRDAFAQAMGTAGGRGAADIAPQAGAVAQMLRESGGRQVDAETVARMMTEAGEATPTQPAMLAGEGLKLRIGQELQTLERIPVPLHQTRDFGEAVGQRVMLMVGREMQGARIELNPVDLGPMEINLQLRGNEATVHFGAAHALTREAIEAAIPRLRDLLAEQGFTQVNVNVGQQQGQNAQAFNGQGGQAGQGGSGFGQQNGGNGPEGQSAQVKNVEMRIRESGVDLFV